MYCPKCKQTFEEGSRRFCPTDGTRLISEAAEQTSARAEGGIFRHLLPRLEAERARDESLARKAPPRAPQPAPEFTPGTDAFFEFDDVDLELDDLHTVDQAFIDHAVSTPAPPPPVPRRVTRKIDISQVPAGHVDLATREEATQSLDLDFDIDNPKGFVGRTVKGRYNIVEFLGGGGDGLAYLAEDKLSGDRKVLVRILLDGESDGLVGSFLAEERVALSHLDHPNIARLIDSGELGDGTSFLITEYIDALSVRDVLEVNGRLEPARASRIVRQAAYALNDAHQQGIIHRDLRPENLILDPSEDGTEQLKIVNFGSSDGTPNEHNLSYKSPEVLDGRRATAASDIFSLAVVAYEMLTGRLPFMGDSPRDLIHAHHAGLELPASSVNPGVSRAVDDIFARVFSFTPANRYAKAREFGDALAGVLVVETPPAEPKEAPAPPPRPLVTPPVSHQVTPAAPPAELPAGLKKPMRPVVENVRLEPLETMDDEPAWTRRSPEPLQTGSSKWKWVAAIGIPLLLVLAAIGVIYVIRRPAEPIHIATNEANSVATNTQPDRPPITSNIETPPAPRAIQAPPNSDYFQSTRRELKGDLAQHFIGFSIYYPKEWKVNASQPGSSASGRGKFLDIARETPDGRMKEQMLISYYASKGTFTEDAEKFPQMVKETNETLKKLIPNYQMVSEGDINVNGDWRAYEVKFQGSGTAANGDRLVVWGRRLFIPAARPGVRDGFEITMLATSLADNVQSVDDVGVRGELAQVLFTFEPSQTF